MKSAAAKNLPAAPNALSVSQLTAKIKDQLEDEFPSVWVVGEISNFARPQSGHCYFSLKDDKAQIRAVIWRGTTVKLGFQPTDGMEIVCRGHIDVYAPRGSYQLVIEEAIPKGVGALELALRKLKEKLAGEGLFDPERKRRLPMFPRRIGVVTSPSGAAIRDFLEVLRRRWRGVHIMIFPARVQGDGAAAEIAAGIRAAAQVRPLIDVVVVTRGGGSLEDLWAFNEEVVVRAISACPIPTVSAVGHEIDVSLSDLVADVRALTPSEAAERVLPAAADVEGLFRATADRIHAALRRRIETAQARIDAASRQRCFRRPFEQTQDRFRRLDEMSLRATRMMYSLTKTRRGDVATLAGKLESLSPLGVLARGYSVTRRARDGAVVRSSGDVLVSESVITRLASGEIRSTVDEIMPNA